MKKQFLQAQQESAYWEGKIRDYTQRHDTMMGEYTEFAATVAKNVEQATRISPRIDTDKPYDELDALIKKLVATLKEQSKT